MKIIRYLAPTVTLVAVAVLFVNTLLSTDDSDPGFANAIVVKSAAAQEKKHGGDIIFEVKKNKQNLQHSLFSHQLHIDAGSTCNDCHNDKVFKKERKLGNNKFTMKDIMAGKACGACHNGRSQVKGKAVFHPKNNCKRCHSAKFRKRRR